MVRSESGAPTTGTFFDTMCESVRLVVEVCIGITSLDENSSDCLEILMNPRNNVDRLVNCLFVFDKNPAEILSGFYGRNNNLDRKITALLSYVSKYKKHPDKVGVISSQKLINEETIFQRISSRNQNNPVMNFDFSRFLETRPDVEGIDSYLNAYRKEYLKNDYGRRCDELYQDLIPHPRFRIDPPDHQVSDPCGKMNYCHFAINKDYAFYLVDYFFDLPNDVNTRWKHWKKGQGTPPKLNVSNRIKKLLKDRDFVIPPNIS
ncbi:hypothetical protein HO757_08855 [Streptococcus suis]|uniref:Uncharacterized protein n=1 Tax=Streptococcus suis TaxID=1307 RepID=A0A0Z8TQC1_STRSU|nr:hypothetical protein [Streptococcus suis]NQN60449.1 hypothetical protein [Streptococcus suis]NQP75888.1 hypothetical protein [Streptococcus suis]NQP77916.1 hypothetical protein [Streptococcus suis]NQP92219.1 hypothetical protein [Streptococcus suis]NQP94210.1 hypothetical protein [Streptococcus suis]